MVTEGKPVPLSPAEILERRKLAAELLEWACYPGAESEDDPRYQQVVEGRDSGAAQKRYSSCADLAHWLLFRLGARFVWINRDELDGWRMGANVSRLVRPGRKTPPKPAELDAGDTLIIANDWPSGRDSHVVCVRGPATRRPDGVWVVPTAEYGQPGGALCLRELRGTMLGKRRIRIWLPLDAILQEAAAAGMLEPFTLPAEMEASENETPADVG